MGVNGFDEKSPPRICFGNTVEIVANGLLVLISVVVFLEVIYRYILQAPLVWSQEIATFAFIWYCILCAAIGVRDRNHFAIEVLFKRLPRSAQPAVTLLVALSVSALLVILVWAGMAVVMLNSGQRSPILNMPMSLPYLAVPVGGALMLVYLWKNVADDLRR